MVCPKARPCVGVCRYYIAYIHTQTDRVVGGRGGVLRWVYPLFLKRYCRLHTKKTGAIWQRFARIKILSAENLVVSNIIPIFAAHIRSDVRFALTRRGKGVMSFASFFCACTALRGIRLPTLKIRGVVLGYPQPRNGLRDCLNSGY